MNPHDEKEQELDRLLAATADVVGWDDPTARDRIRHVVKEPCTDPRCVFCDKPAKEKRHMSIGTAWTLFRIAIAIWTVAVVAFLALAMVFGEDLP